MGEFAYPAVFFETHPDKYVHWDLQIEGQVATLTMHIKEDHPMWEGLYELKLNSYDLAVDIELHDAINRLRFEHPEVRCVLVTGAYDKIFCAGANIRFLGNAPHAFKVNFCKYTNETRCGIEDATAQSGQVYVAALNGTASGGGYELALACEEIYLIDDGNAAVALPEVPLLGVLPGTGGLTRLTDKRKIRRDLSDIFCTKAEGFRARDAKKYNFIDGSFPRSKWAAGVQDRANEIVTEQNAKFPNRTGEGVALPPLTRTTTDDGWSYPSVEVSINGRVANLLLKGPEEGPERSADTWSLRAFRELEDALLHLRINHLEVGLINIRTTGDSAKVLEHEKFIIEGANNDWFLNEVKHFQSQCLRRLDNMAKSVFAIIEPGHCFDGILFELTLAADRSYMLLDEEEENTVELSQANAGEFPMANGLSRLVARFPGDPEAPGVALDEDGPIDAETAEDLGIVTAAPDDIDWDDEIRIAIEERISMSPDALTGMEQNLRFGGSENCETKIYGRLSAWQNWIFQRPNAVGDRGALTLYGHPERPVFDFRRT
ncbi:MAG: benzoyl-CoA-dihydrodiol lyase [Deltaproteobacteria bacterium]|nr:benzoyl-CoA-dihydrodiol lyase [Deltaproteobacteria bacterium]